MPRTQPDSRSIITLDETFRNPVGVANAIIVRYDHGADGARCTIGAPYTLKGRFVTIEPSATDAKIAKLFAQLMIARPDVKAIQNSAGEYRPLRGERFTKDDLLAHIRGERTYGHYLVDPDDQVKMFCFDIDLEKTGSLPISKAGTGMFSMFKDIPKEEDGPRGYWMSRKQGAGREFIKLQLRMLAGQLASEINKLEIQTAVAYSGSKGVHVYGFLGGKRSAKFAREGAIIVLDSLRDRGLGWWDLSRGNNFYAYNAGESAGDPAQNYHQFSLEVYPKQDSLEGKDLGNLLRLPLGVNRKSPKDRGFFLDMRAPLTELVKRDPVEALTTPNQWQ